MLHIIFCLRILLAYYLFLFSVIAGSGRWHRSSGTPYIYFDNSRGKIKREEWT